jgi:hypothetical protein
MKYLAVKGLKRAAVISPPQAPGAVTYPTVG